jgi:hypothetical protein
MIEKGISQEQLANEIGITQMAISNLINDKVQKPRNLLDIANALGVDPNWLQNGTGSSVTFGERATLNSSPITATTNHYYGRSEDSVSNKREVDSSQNVTVVRNLVLPKEVINNDISHLFNELSFSAEGLMVLVKRFETSDIAMLTMFNDSMSPTIEKGEVVLVNTACQKYAGEGIYVFVMNNELYVRRLRQTPDGILQANASNEIAGTSFEITHNNLVRVQILGKCQRVLTLNSRDI